MDTPKLLARGAHPATIAAYCLLAICFGYVGFRRQCIRVLSAGKPSPGTRGTPPPKPGQGG